MSAYNDSKIPLPDNWTLTLAHRNKYKVLLIVEDSDSISVLRLNKSEHLQLIKRICRINQIVDCFSQNLMIVLEKQNMIFPPTACFINPITLLFLPTGSGLSTSYYDLSNQCYYKHAQFLYLL